MGRLLCSLTLVVCFVPLLNAADKTNKPEPPAPTALDRLKADPNDSQGLNSLMREKIGTVNELIDDEKIEEAEKVLAGLKADLATITATEEAGIKRLESAKSAVVSYEEEVELARTPIADLEKRLDADADDIAAVVKYKNKVTNNVYKIAVDEPAKAADLIKVAKSRLEKVRERAEDAPVKRQVTTALKSLTSLEARVANYQELLDLSGKSAAPLHDELEGWVNGQPLTDVDLKGKVVLLDFWAIWCGPCIATFPHLREWNEKYGDKGLVIIGLTRYYNFNWDDAEGRPVRSEEKLSEEQEQEMLRKFAAHHSLHHRFAIQKKEGTLDDYYKVQGIPHVVVIDQEGKIRLIRVGSGSRNAKKIDALLAELLETKVDVKAGQK